MWGVALGELCQYTQTGILPYKEFFKRSEKTPSSREEDLGEIHKKESGQKNELIEFKKLGLNSRIGWKHGIQQIIHFRLQALFYRLLGKYVGLLWSWRVILVV
jgi:hypothetical protein